MSVLRHTALFFFLAGILSPLPAFAQLPLWLAVSPEDIYKPPNAPSCYTIAVGNGAYMTIDFEYIGPWGYDVVYGWPTLDENGQAYICADENATEGQYTFLSVRNSEYPWFVLPVWAQVTVHAAPPSPPPVVNGYGPSCDNWDCIWATGYSFMPDSRVIVVSPDWAHQESYYGLAWGAWPPLSVNAEGDRFELQLQDSDIKHAFGSGGVYFLVVNGDGTTSAWNTVGGPPPAVYSASPTCSDLYCLSFSGSFPLNAYVDIRTPAGFETIPDAYTDLSVTPTQITLRLNANARQVFDTTGLRAWVVNPALQNWSSDSYFAPLDRSVVGRIDGVDQQGSDYYIYGWACARTFAQSIDVHFYAGGSFLFATTASGSSEAAVAAECRTGEFHYRYWAQIPPGVIQEHVGEPIYAYGISPTGLGNLPLTLSGSFRVPGALSLSRREYIYLGDRLLAIDSQ